MMLRSDTSALEGVKVLEAGHLIAGPFCGRLFADHGAEVVKVESPGAGDALRTWGGLYEGVGLYWSNVGRGKKSVTIDLRQPAGQSLFRELIAEQDVLVENFRPGTLESWGCAPERLLEINPGLVIIRVSGYGQTGPYRDRAGFGSVGEAMSGFRFLCGEPERPPVRVGVSIGDAVAGTHAFIGGLLALRARDQGLAGGQVVDVALYEAMWTYMESLVAEYEKLGHLRQRTGSTLPGIAPSNVYPTADGEWLVIGANQDSVFKRLAHLMGRDDLVREGSPYLSHVDRGNNQVRLDQEIVAWTAARSADDLLRELEAAGIPSGRIFTAPDILADPHYEARDMVIRVPEPSLGGEEVPMPGVVPKLSATPGRVRAGAPLLGADNDAVFQKLRSPDELARLRAAGTI